MSNRLSISLIIVLGVFVVMFHVGAKKQPDTAQQKNVNEFFTRQAEWEGRYPPDFELELLDGTTFRLSEVIGTRLVVLNFFTTWCGPCRGEMPELAKYHKDRKDRQFLMLGIDEREEKAKVKGFLEGYHAAYPVGIDGDGSIDSKYSVRGFPTTVIIGADGIVKAYIIGPVANANVAFDAYLTEAEQLIADGKAITAEGYLAALKGQDEQSDAVEKPQKEKEAELSGRAESIAKAMLCPCGCKDMVSDCKCGTAKKIRERLRTMNLEGKTDAEVIRELNAEFCVGGNDKS